MSNIRLLAIGIAALIAISSRVDSQTLTTRFAPQVGTISNDANSVWTFHTSSAFACGECNFLVPFPNSIGVMEFDMLSIEEVTIPFPNNEINESIYVAPFVHARPLPSSRLTLDVFDTAASVDPRFHRFGPNTTAIDAYPANGIIEVDDRSGPSTHITTVSTDPPNSRRIDVPLTVQADGAKNVLSSQPGPLGFRFTPLNVTTWEGFGNQVGDPFGSVPSLTIDDDPREVLLNAYFKVLGDYSGRPNVIGASFVPVGSAGPVPMRDLAKALGYENFNWIQLVRNPPGVEDFRVELGANGEIVEEHPIGGDDRLDPENDPTKRVLLRREINGKPIETIVYESFVPDTLPFLYNENGSGAGTIGNHTGEHYLSFFDAPIAPDEFLLPGEFTEYETHLVGVKTGGLDFEETGFSFRWKSNAVYDSEKFRQSGELELIGGRSLFIQSVDSFSGLPAVTSGGIFDIELTRPVPEPATVTLLGLCLLYLLTLVLGRSVRVTRGPNNAEGRRRCRGTQAGPCPCSDSTFGRHNARPTS